MSQVADMIRPNPPERTRTRKGHLPHPSPKGPNPRLRQATILSRGPTLTNCFKIIFSLLALYRRLFEHTRVHAFRIQVAALMRMGPYPDRAGTHLRWT